MAYLRKMHFCVWHDIFFFSGLAELSVDSQARVASCLHIWVSRRQAEGGSGAGLYRRRRAWVQMDQSPQSRTAVIGREEIRWRFGLLSSNSCKICEGAFRLPTRTAERGLRVFRWAA